MKIYIITDIEGISGIDCLEMIQPGDSQYKHAINRLMADTNAAIDGAFAGGATHVTVLDGHGGGNNFDLSLLDKRAEVDRLENGKWKLDESYCGIFAVGAHAMAGTLNGFLDHTQSSKQWFNYYINGKKSGELAQWAAKGAHFGVPMIMVSSDEAGCAEAKQFFEQVECAVVKSGIGRNNAKLVDVNEALVRIRDAAKKAMQLADKAKPYEVSYPAEIKLELYRSDFCDQMAIKPDVERIDARTIKKIAQNGLEVMF